MSREDIENALKRATDTKACVIGENILADQIEHQCRVGSIAKGIKEGYHILGKLVIDEDQVFLGNA